MDGCLWLLVEQLLVVAVVVAAAVVFVEELRIRK
jgi:hypothetical protein